MENRPFAPTLSKENYLMKITKQLIIMTPLALLVAGCMPVRPNPTISEWEQEGQLPRLTPTGNQGQRVYAQSVTYPLDDRPSIIVEPGSQQNRGSDLALAKAIRRHIEYDASLAPSLSRVTIAVNNNVVTLQGSVNSDLDARVIVNNLRDVSGVTLVKNDLEISPGWY
jgi:hypothetical protein